MQNVDELMEPVMQHNVSAPPFYITGAPFPVTWRYHLKEEEARNTFI